MARPAREILDLDPGVLSSENPATFPPGMEDDPEANRKLELIVCRWYLMTLAGLLGLTFGIHLMGSRKLGRNLGLAMILASALVAGGLVSTFFIERFFYKVREVSQVSKMGRSLRYLAVALHSYAANEGKGTFPPRAILSKDGKPLLSWRVIILPYIEQDALYKEFRLDEPWDSPHNITLLEKMPSLFEPFFRRNPEPFTTCYQVVAGKGAGFEGSKGMRLQEDFPDGPKTILVAVAKNPVPWTKPEDLIYYPDGPLPEFGGIKEKSFAFVFFDGTTRIVSHKISEKTLRSAITRNGRDELGPDWDMD